MSLGICANVYQEKFAMPGWLQMATSGLFDDVFVVSSPPADAPPDEETIELIKAAGVRLIHTTIDAGYGVVRTRCMREAKTEWLLISDADERIPPMLPLLRCEGTEKYPDTPTPNLSVFRDQQSFDQGALIRSLIASAGGKDAIRMSRRAWFDAPGVYQKPQQSWSLVPDWQLRLVRAANPFLFYDPNVLIHERLLHSQTWTEPSWATGDQVRGPFIEHHSGYFKAMEPEQNATDAEIYERLEAGCVEKMWLHHAPGVNVPKQYLEV